MIIITYNFSFYTLSQVSIVSLINAGFPIICKNTIGYYWWLLIVRLLFCLKLLFLRRQQTSKLFPFPSKATIVSHWVGWNDTNKGANDRDFLLNVLPLSAVVQMVLWKRSAKTYCICSNGWLESLLLSLSSSSSSYLSVITFKQHAHVTKLIICSEIINIIFIF